MTHTKRYYLLLLFSIAILYACKKATIVSNMQHDFTQQYSIYENKIYKLNNAIQVIGANAFHSFSAGGSDMAAWKLDIAREFVGNMKDNPLTGGVLLDANGSYLHSLQAVVDSNRRQGRITILCPFGWDGTNGTIFTGKSPRQQSFFSQYKQRLTEWATHFKNQPDVWLEVWNEPYRYDRADGYTDAVWNTDMTIMIDAIRNTGNNNIVLVPCAEQGQDESVLLTEGKNLLGSYKNILFDIHAYEKWLLVSNASMSTRLTTLQQNKIPVLFGEVAPMNAGILMNPQFFLTSAYNNGMSICAWVWKYDGNDTNALLDANGNPNNNGNNNWGTTYKNIAIQVRRP